MARGFIFELEVVLEDRQRKEQQKQKAVALLEIERQRLLSEAVQLQRSMVMSREVLRDQLGAAARVDVGSVRMQANSSLHAMIDLQRVALKAAGVQQKLNGARAELMAAAVAKKAVETLKAKRYAEWRREQDRKEAAELDDLVLMRAGGRNDDASAGEPKEGMI